MHQLRSNVVLLMAALGLAVVSASAQPRFPDRFRDDPRSWVELGTKLVDFHTDRYTIDVGRREGHFTHLMFKVEDGDMIVEKVRVTYGAHEVAELDFRAEFREGSRSFAIDLPGGAHTVWRVDFVARSEHRRDPARLVLFGKQAIEPAVIGAGPRPRWDDYLWTELGSKVVDFHTERNVIEVGRREGWFTHLLFKVEEGDMIVERVRVVYGDGEVWESTFHAEFREGSRSASIDLPGYAHTVWRVEFIARSEHRRDPARIVLWGKQAP